MRSNLTDEDPATLWQYYMQLTEIEQAFKDLKHDLAIRPVFHQREARILGGRVKSGRTGSTRCCCTNSSYNCRHSPRHASPPDTTPSAQRRVVPTFG